MTDSIDTEYAGHKFRSRLEARWAVLFDTAGLRWEYEPQGYRIAMPGEQRSYLPDFWLPSVGGQGVWCEVKGSAETLDLPLMAYAAHPDHGLPARPDGGLVIPTRPRRILILGPIPTAGLFSLPLHCCLSWRGSGPQPGVYAEAVFLHGPFLFGTELSTPVLAADGTLLGTRDELWDLINGSRRIHSMELLYRKARRARFEHGETPLPPDPGEAAAREPTLVSDSLRERIAAFGRGHGQKDGAA